ncbi:hypothetical protein K525DRAFT_245163, partial [Schizophyllum commune Loenen D]
MLTTPSRLVYHLGYSLQWSVGTNLAVTRSLLAPVTRPTDLILPDDIGLSRLGPRVPSKATCSSRTPSGLQSRPFAPTYDSLLALVHDGGIDAGVAVVDDDEGERRARPVAQSRLVGFGTIQRSTLTVTRRADLDAYVRRLRALVNADGRVTRRQTRDPESFLSMLSRTGVRLCAAKGGLR